MTVLVFLSSQPCMFRKEEERKREKRRDWPMEAHSPTPTL
jgi:hypothetical protein